MTGYVFDGTGPDVDPVTGDEAETEPNEAVQTPEIDGAECVGADFSKVAAHLGQGLVAHADRDGLTGVKRAVFMDRGGHAPGDPCPTAPPMDPHDYWCQWPDDECSCSHIRPGSQDT